MIRRSPDLMLIVIVITTIGAIATRVARSAPILDKSPHAYLQNNSWGVHARYFDAFANSNFHPEEGQQQYLSLAVGKPKFEHFFQRIELVLGKPRYTYAITLQLGLSYQGTGFELNMGEAKLTAPLYKTPYTNYVERTTSRYGFVGFEVRW